MGVRSFSEMVVFTNEAAQCCKWFYDEFSVSFISVLYACIKMMSLNVIGQPSLSFYEGADESLAF
jgi:hypothetical protein